MQEDAASRRSCVRRGSEAHAHESLESQALRDSLQNFLHTHARGPLVVLELLRFNFGWSTFPAALVAGAGLDDAVRARPLNSVGLSGGGLGDLAALLGVEGGVGEAVARECAGSMNRPIVREEAFRFCFAWLERERGAAELVRDQFGALELLLLLAVTDTWSAVRKASARSIESAHSWAVDIAVFRGLRSLGARLACTPTPSAELRFKDLSYRRTTLYELLQIAYSIKWAKESVPINEW